MIGIYIYIIYRYILWISLGWNWTWMRWSGVSFSNWEDLKLSFKFVVIFNWETNGLGYPNFLKQPYTAVCFGRSTFDWYLWSYKLIKFRATIHFQLHHALEPSTSFGFSLFIFNIYIVYYHFYNLIYNLHIIESSHIIYSYYEDITCILICIYTYTYWSTYWWWSNSSLSILHGSSLPLRKRSVPSSGWRLSCEKKPWAVADSTR